MPFFPARDGESLKVRIIGRGQPVLVLHGLGMQSRDWLPYVLPFTRRYRFFLPDFRGAGGSSRVRFNQPDVFHNHMQDMEDLVSHFGLRDFPLVGYSLGATTSLHWHAFGDFTPVRRYLHIDQTPCIANGSDWPHGLFGNQQTQFFAQLEALLALLDGAPDSGPLDALAAGLREAVLGQLLDIFSKVAGRPGLHTAYQSTRRWSALWARLLPVADVADLRAYLQAYLFHTHDYRASVANFPVPATVVTGALSPLYPAAGQAEFARQLHARHVVLGKSGHVPLMSQPVAFTRALGRFLNE